MTKAPIAPENIQLVYNGQITDPNQPLSAYTSADGDILQEIRYHGMKPLFRIFRPSISLNCSISSVYSFKNI